MAGTGWQSRRGQDQPINTSPRQREEIFHLKDAAGVRMDGDTLLMDREQV